MLESKIQMMKQGKALNKKEINRISSRRDKTQITGLETNLANSQGEIIFVRPAGKIQETIARSVYKNKNNLIKTRETYPE